MVPTTNIQKFQQGEMEFVVATMALIPGKDEKKESVAKR